MCIATINYRTVVNAMHLLMINVYPGRRGDFYEPTLLINLQYSHLCRWRLYACTSEKHILSVRLFKYFSANCCNGKAVLNFDCIRANILY